MYRTNSPPVSMRNAALYSRLGDYVCDDNGCYDTGTTTTVTTPIDTSGSSGDGIDWTSILRTGLEDATKIAAVALRPTGQQPYIMTSATGQRVLYNPATGMTTPAPITGAALNTNTLLLAAAALIGVVLISRK